MSEVTRRGGWRWRSVISGLPAPAGAGTADDPVSRPQAVVRDAVLVLAGAGTLQVGYAITLPSWENGSATTLIWPMACLVGVLLGRWRALASVYAWMLAVLFSGSDAPFADVAGKITWVDNPELLEWQPWAQAIAITGLAASALAAGALADLLLDRQPALTIPGILAALGVGKAIAALGVMVGLVAGATDISARDAWAWSLYVAVGADGIAMLASACVIGIAVAILRHALPGTLNAGARS